MFSKKNYWIAIASVAVVLGFASCEKKPTGGTASKAPVIEFSHPTLKTDNADFSVTISYEGTDLRAEWRIEDPAKPDGTGIGGPAELKPLSTTNNWGWQWNGEQRDRMKGLPADAMFVFTVTYGTRDKTVSEGVPVEVADPGSVTPTQALAVASNYELLVGEASKFELTVTIPEGLTLETIRFETEFQISDKPVSSFGGKQVGNTMTIPIVLSQTGLQNLDDLECPITVTVKASDGSEASLSIDYASEALTCDKKKLYVDDASFTVDIWQVGKVAKASWKLDYSGVPDVKEDPISPVDYSNGYWLWGDVSEQLRNKARGAQLSAELVFTVTYTKGPTVSLRVPFDSDGTPTQSLAVVSNYELLVGEASKFELTVTIPEGLTLETIRFKALYQVTSDRPVSSFGGKLVGNTMTIPITLSQTGLQSLDDLECPITVTVKASDGSEASLSIDYASEALTCNKTKLYVDDASFTVNIWQVGKVAKASWELDYSGVPDVKEDPISPVMYSNGYWLWGDVSEQLRNKARGAQLSAELVFTVTYTNGPTVSLRVPFDSDGTPTQAPAAPKVSFRSEGKTVTQCHPQASFTVVIEVDAGATLTEVRWEYGDNTRATQGTIPVNKLTKSGNTYTITYKDISEQQGGFITQDDMPARYTVFVTDSRGKTANKRLDIHYIY